MFKNIGDLEDKSAAGIVRAANAGELPAGDVRYSGIIGEARDLVDDGRGDLLYGGTVGGKAKWVDPMGVDEAGSEGRSEA